MPSFKTVLLAAALLLAVAGCTSTNPKAAFDDVGKTVAARNRQQVRWMRNDADNDGIQKAVEAALQTNLTAQSAVATALLNNRTLQAEFEEIDISQAQLAQASRLRNPEFAGFWRVPTHGATVVNAEYSLAQNLLDLLTLPARKQIAARNLETTKLRIAHQVLTLSEEVQAAFYTVQAGQQLTNRLALIVEVNEAAADITQRQYDAGNINDLELQNQLAAYAQSRLDFARAHAQLRARREGLNRLLGLWGKQTMWQAESELPPLPEKELPVENVESLAISQRLDLAAARAEAENVQRALKLKKSVRWLPAVSVGVNAEHDLDHSWVIGPSLSLEVPVFDQGQPELARLAAEYRRAARKFEALAVNIRSEVREAREALIAARDAAEYYQKVLLPQRQRSLRATLLQYNAMQLSNFVLLASKEREALAEREAIEVLRDYWIARARLESAAGGSLIGEISATTTPKLDSKELKQHDPEHNH
jgi:cobalt-zinc-cadmium efflux system outer membrane protein